eukprot:gene10303-2721_t
MLSYLPTQNRFKIRTVSKKFELAFASVLSWQTFERTSDTPKEIFEQICFKKNFYLSRIELENCSVQEEEMLKNFKNLESANLGSSYDLKNVNNLASSSNSLKTLFLDNSSVNDISAFKNFKKLTILDLENTKVTDITPLQECRYLRDIYMSQTKISDISSLSNCSSLERGLFSSTSISDITPLSNCSNLEILFLNSSQIQSLKPLEKCLKLNSLHFKQTQVESLEPLKNCREMKILRLDATNVNDVSPLQNMKKLFYLNISSTNVLDISVFSNFKLLSKLFISHTSIKDISVLSNCQHLELLLMSNTLVDDISSLANCKKLKHLDLKNTLVKDITALKECTMLEKLDLESTGIKDINSLCHLKNLIAVDLSFTEIRNLEPLENCLKLNELYVGNTSITSIEPLRSLYFLEELQIESTDVSDLCCLKDKRFLSKLDISSTKVSSILPLSTCTSLQYFFMNSTKISNLIYLKNCSKLRQLDVSESSVLNLPLFPFKYLSEINVRILLVLYFTGLSKFLTAFRFTGLSLLSGYVIAHWCNSTKKFKKIEEYINNPVYDIKDLKVPRLAGLKLSILASVVENNLIGPLLCPFLLKDSGTSILDDLVCSKPMTLYPIRKTDLKEKENFEEEFERISKYHSKDDSVFVSICQFSKAYKDGKTTPLEVAKKIIEQVKESNKGEKYPLRSIINLNEKLLLEQATASTDRYKEGCPLSIFDGVPISIKDEADLIGYPTKLGTKLTEFSNNIATEDSSSFKNFRKYGAMFIGKCNMAEIGISTRSLNIHPYYQIARNPYNIQHEIGGSSSGSGSSVASGLCPISVGADGGGSIRIPASFCGVFGLKPTSGRVPTEQKTRPVCYSVGVLGPLASTAHDLTLGYMAMSDTSPNAPSLGLKEIQPQSDDFYSLKGTKIGIHWDYFNDCDPEVATICTSVVNKIYKEIYGGDIIDIKIPLLQITKMSHLVTIAAEMRACMNDVYPSEDFLPESRIPLGLFSHVNSITYIQAQRVRTHMMDEIEEIFKKVDVIITPTISIPPPKIKEDTNTDGESDSGIVSKIMKYVFIANFTGIPAISIPVGYTKDKVPIGIQIQSKWWNEAQLLKFAYLTEREIKREKPQIHYSSF